MLTLPRRPTVLWPLSRFKIIEEVVDVVIILEGKLTVHDYVGAYAVFFFCVCDHEQG